MIPRADIVAWRKYAPWKLNEQIEQDLLISAMVARLFADRKVSENFAFRGGTALNKLFLPEPARYSEDIDLALITDLSSQDVIDCIINALRPLMGKPVEYKWRTRDAFFRYSIDAEIPPPKKFNIKVDIACYDRLPLGKLQHIPYSIDTRWYSGECEVVTYDWNELLGTKLRALFQRKRGRDLFDLWYSLTNLSCNPEKIVEFFFYYIWEDPVTRDEFQNNIDEKMVDHSFINDTQDLLRSDIEYDIDEAYNILKDKLLIHLK